MLHNQINENEAYNTMYALCSALLHTLDSCMGTKGKNFVFLKKVMVHMTLYN